MRRPKRKPGLILSAVLLLAMAIFGFMLYSTEILPEQYLKMVLIGMAAVLLLIFILTINFNHRVLFFLGLLFWFAGISAMVFSGFYLFRTRSALDGITDVKTEISREMVYVRKDTAVDGIEEAKDYKFGILSELDRTNTDMAVSMLGKKLESDVNTIEFDSITQMLDGLFQNQVDAVILNAAYLTVLSGMEGYEDVETRLKVLDTVAVERDIAGTMGDVLDDGTEEARPAFVEDGIITLYVSGIDSREGLVANSLSDVNIILVANTDTKQLLLLSTPRDFFVPLSISGGVKDKLTHAGIYGVGVSMDTLSMLYDMDLSYYLRVNFGGFVDIIDTLGGVTVYSDYEFDSQNELGYHFKKGENFMTGAEALAFARERFSFADGDRQRGKNQMAVINGILNKLSALDVLGNFSSMIESLKGCFETNVSYKEIAALVQNQLAAPAEWEVFSYSVTGSDDTQPTYSMSQPVYVMVPDEDTVAHACDLVKMVQNGEKLTKEMVSTVPVTQENDQADAPETDETDGQVSSQTN